MCRVCLKRPEIPDERYGRCETCVKGGRIAYRFRLAVRPGGLAVRAGELSPAALHKKLHDQLAGYTSAPSTKPHLGLHEVELVTANRGERLETVRIAADLQAQSEGVLLALRAAAERTDAAW